MQPGDFITANVITVKACLRHNVTEGKIASSSKCGLMEGAGIHHRLKETSQTSDLIMERLFPSSNQTGHFLKALRLGIRKKIERN